MAAEIYPVTEGKTKAQASLGVLASTPSEKKLSRKEGFECFHLCGLPHCFGAVINTHCRIHVELAKIPLAPLRAHPNDLEASPQASLLINVPLPLTNAKLKTMIFKTHEPLEEGSFQIKAILLGHAISHENGKG